MAEVEKVGEGRKVKEIRGDEWFTSSSTPSLS